MGCMVREEEREKKVTDLIFMLTKLTFQQINIVNKQKGGCCPGYVGELAVFRHV